MSTLTKAVEVHQAYEEAVKDHPNPSSLVFEDLSQYKWCETHDEVYFWNPPSCEGNVHLYSYELEYRHAVDEDDNYIMFYINDGCGSQWHVVFDKNKKSDEEM
ncbi:hypothetical protein nepoznato_183 [Escherichia phage nepoznato]|uniref:Uncharacterized protein n=1 Tax=Escherichia phage nepoznato TaxID=2696431 RepID=A0A6B9WLP2_9CAUD|nr:hypothetical protein JR323_gp094 [Escherichia phage nepoznato]QHR65632.1 hypothetical protein nepoznato_183 [Escherichia phage nepoznato]